MVTFTSQKRLDKDFELELSTIFVFLIRTVFDEFCVSMQLQTLTRKLTQLWYEKRVVSVMVSHSDKELLWICNGHVLIRQTLLPT